MLQSRLQNTVGTLLDLVLCEGKRTKLNCTDNTLLLYKLAIHRSAGVEVRHRSLIACGLHGSVESCFSRKSFELLVVLQIDNHVARTLIPRPVWIDLRPCSNRAWGTF
jgi:hypothetical protein